MCGGQPCFTSVCGISLKKAVLIVGIVELAITVVATILNIIKYAAAVGAFDEDFGSECKDKDVCIGPIIKYAVFDGFFGVGCALLLIFGAHLRNHCLLISWMIITVIISFKYIWVVVTHDWTSLEVAIGLKHICSDNYHIMIGLDLNHLPSLLHRCLCHNLRLHEGGSCSHWWNNSWPCPRLNCCDYTADNLSPSKLHNDLTPFNSLSTSTLCLCATTPCGPRLQLLSYNFQ